MPEKLVPCFKAAEFRISEILLNRFLEENYIDLVLAEVVFEKGTAPPAPEPSDVPNETLHWETKDKARARRVRGLELTMGCFFFLYALGFFLGTGFRTDPVTESPFSSSTGPSYAEAAFLSAATFSLAASWSALNLDAAKSACASSLAWIREMISSGAPAAEGKMTQLSWATFRRFCAGTS
jgi:hypothetical protein